MAVNAVLTEVPTCKEGHPLTPDNLAWDKSGRDGVRRARCQTCKRETTRRSRAKYAPAPVRSMIVPRQTRGGKTVVAADDAYATRRLFSLMDKTFRDRVAAVVMDDTVDDLQRRVLEKAANRWAWTATPPDVVVRLYVEAVIAETVDARSSLLRLDVLLGLLWR